MVLLRLIYWNILVVTWTLMVCLKYTHLCCSYIYFRQTIRAHVITITYICNSYTMGTHALPHLPEGLRGPRASAYISGKARVPIFIYLFFY